MAWFEVKLKVPEPMQEAVTSRLFELGAEGVDESSALKDGTLSAFFPENRPQILEELKPFLDSLSALHPKAEKISAELKVVEPINWGEKYREFYRAQRLSHHFFLKPLWDKETPVPRDLFPIVMDPSQAFGTGLHATTKLSMRWIERALGGVPKPQEATVLDIGTGTGILAITAEKLGVPRVLAIDIDLPSVEVARENIAANGCTHIEVSETPVQKIRESFSIVVANILLETHLELFDEYKRVLQPRGQLILSGLLSHQCETLLRKVKKDGLVLEGITHLQEWGALCFSKWETKR